MDYVFLGYACDILADTNNGLTGSEIIKYCSRYALKYDSIFGKKFKINNYSETIL